MPPYHLPRSHHGPLWPGKFCPPFKLSPHLVASLLLVAPVHIWSLPVSNATGHWTSHLCLTCSAWYHGYCWAVGFVSTMREWDLWGFTHDSWWLRSWCISVPWQGGRSINIMPLNGIQGRWISLTLIFNEAFIQSGIKSCLDFLEMWSDKSLKISLS